MKEAFASRLAAHFGLLVPAPAIVLIEQDLAELIVSADPLKADIVMRSIGLNFGTELLTGSITWPVDKTIPAPMLQSATDIFAFDALVQNPDRRYMNPNLLARGDEFHIFDHELAFSFLNVLGQSPTPWNLDDQTYLTEHVFYNGLRSEAIDLIDFTSSLGSLSDGVIAAVVEELPSEWNNEDVTKVTDHLAALRDHAAEFAEAVRRFLV